ncbi:MAG: ABC transporter permease [Trueperaceae bacterium]
MAKFLVTRILSMTVTAIAVSVVVMLLVHAVPGNIVQQMLGQLGAGSLEARASLESYFGLNRSLPVQYWDWVSTLLSGSLGTSWNRGIPVEQLVFTAFQVTLQLGLLSLAFATVVGVILGIISSLTKGRWPDTLIQSFNILGLSLPSFWVGAMFLVIASQYFDWGPPIRYRSFAQDPTVNLQIMLLPVLSLGLFNAAAISQFLRELIIGTERQEYVRTAYSKGLSGPHIYVKHIFRNVLIPLVSFIGVISIGVLGGVVAIESVFNLPGVGRLIISALQTRDYPLVQGGVLVLAGVTMLVNLIVDVLYVVIDPRITYS